MTEVEERRPRRKGRGWKVAVAVVVLAAGGATAAAVLRPGTGRSAAQTDADLPISTVEVTRQTLDDTHTADGELGYGETTTAVNRLRGTLTAVPDGGAVVKRGQALYAVDDQPVTLLYGAVPAYRTLAPGTEGADVRQLEENLAALGHTGFTVDEEYTGATAEAVSAWQASQGVEETGTVQLGRIVFAPGEARVDSVAAGVGEPVAPGVPVLAYTGTEKAVVVELDPADQRMARPGATVTATLPDGSTTPGRIAEVATVIEPGDGQGQEPATKVRVLVPLADQKAAEMWALASVDVTFTAERREDVLTVPVAALVALAEGGFGVEVVAGSASRYVPVRTGLFAGGRVEVTGDGLAEGTTVGVPE
ncbi:efflux RND transporter periplasmic adaptor subunit [Actinophytocola gossypii]|uniref:Peptidoglycan-binding protein n=1 Tax=Actinophytocola gossypii TaxID=2812003 RepID=A0ABT2JC50_9PSEU|nr:efflux RND transporter periplasmic adaptor subunit [Actinophytocola gossypii]MCT2585417.1 peptidoglycan-binding protein [Actinophytocola gossypii]